MDSTASGETRTIIEHLQQQQRKTRKQYKKEIIQDTIEECCRLLTENTEAAYLEVARICENILLPELYEPGQLPVYIDEFEDREDWHGATVLGIERGGFYEKMSEKLDKRNPYEELYISKGQITLDPETKIEQAFNSLVCLAEWHGHIKSEMKNTAAVEGHQLPVGIIREPWERDSPDKIKIVDPAGHPPVSVNQGLPGFGKSTAATAEAEDRYAAGRKVIDVIDLTEFENGLYDVPQGQTTLRDVRADMGLPEDFTESGGYDRPNIEILVPLTSGLSDTEVPFDEDTGEAVVRPFTIPASDLNRKALNMMLSHLTDVQQNYLDRAYQHVSGQIDWSLRDLAECVLETDAQDGVKRRLYNTLATLQNIGFIRTKECEHAIDWESIFRDRETITAFSQATVKDGAHKFMILAYLVHSLYHERQQYHGLPPVTTVFRELHQVAPNNRSARQDETERDLQMGMVAGFQELCSMHRHEDIEVLADTQQLMGQINKRAREHVERVITFRSQMGTLKPLFKDMVGLDGDRYSYLTTIARDFSVGEAAVIGYTGTDRSLEMPIQFSPPMSHHLDAQSQFDDGLRARAEMISDHDDLGSEELRAAPWDVDLPEKLQFEEMAIAEDKDPVEAFATECLVEQKGRSVGIGELMDSIREFVDDKGMDEEDIPVKSHFGRMLGDHLDFDKDEKQINGHRETVYFGIGFSATGERYRP